MSGRSRGKYWSVSLLKRRGWTSELIRELLPAPHYIPRDGHSIRVWDKEDVCAAERDPRFAHPAGTSAGASPSPASPAPAAQIGRAHV